MKIQFPWNKQAADQKAMPVPSKDWEKRRRAIRIETAKDIEVSLLIPSQPKPVSAKVENMSTLGIGVRLDFMPEDAEIQFLFHAPDILKGLKIKGQKRHTEKAADQGREFYQVGFEFVFSSNEQQNQLLRWLTRYLKQYPAKEKQAAPFYTTFFKRSKASGLQIQFPHNQYEFEQCLSMIHPLGIHHALIQTKYFLAVDKKNVIAAWPLIADTLPFGLLADSFFPDRLAKLRSPGARLGEISQPNFHEDGHLVRDPVRGTMQKLIILHAVFPLVLAYAKSFANLTDLIATVPLHLEELYRLWLFQDLGPDAHPVDKQKAENRKGFRLMWLDLKSLEEKLDVQRPELLPLVQEFRNSAKHLNNFADSYFPNAAVLKKWFQDKNHLLEPLNPSQLHYFQSLVPDLALSSK